MFLGKAAPHDPPGASDLSLFPLPGLLENGQQDDPAFRRYPVGDSHLCFVQTEPELSQFAVELAGIRLPKVNSVGLQQIDVEHRACELRGRQFFHPPANLRFEFDATHDRAIML